MGEPRAGSPPRRPLLPPRLHPRELRAQPASTSRQPPFRNTVILERFLLTLKVEVVDFLNDFIRVTNYDYFFTVTICY